MDPLDNVELRAYELTGDIQTAVRARQFIAEAMNRGLIGLCEIADLTIELQHNDA